MKISKMTKFIGSATLALGMSLGFTGAADAAPEYIFYVGGTQNGVSANNDVNWISNAPLTSADFTGRIDFFGGSLEDVKFTTDQINYNSVPFDGWSASDNPSTGFVAEISFIDLVDGNVTGGAFTIRDGEGNTYSASINGGGVLQKQGIDFFSLNNVTFDGNFSSSAFGGIDISGFTGAGTFGMVEFNTSSEVQHMAGIGRTEVSVIVPTPAAALAGLPMLGVLGMAYAIRRRRMANA